MHWLTRERSDRAAICFGGATTVGLCCIGCDLASAGIVGAMIAALSDIPVSSITHVRSSSLRVFPSRTRVRHAGSGDKRTAGQQNFTRVRLGDGLDYPTARVIHNET